MIYPDLKKKIKNVRDTEASTHVSCNPFGPVGVGQGEEVKRKAYDQDAKRGEDRSPCAHIQEDLKALNNSNNIPLPFPLKGHLKRPLDAAAVPSLPSKKARCSTVSSHVCSDASPMRDARVVDKSSFSNYDCASSDFSGLAAPANLHNPNISYPSCSDRFGPSASCSDLVSFSLSKTATSHISVVSSCFSGQQCLKAPKFKPIPTVSSEQQPRHDNQSSPSSSLVGMSTYPLIPSEKSQQAD